LRKEILLLLLFLSICSFIKASEPDVKADSLMRLYDKAEHDTVRIKLLLNIGDIYEYVIPDSAFYYYNKALNFISTVNASNNFQKKLLSLKLYSLQEIGVVYYLKGDFNLAMENFKKSLNINIELDDKIGIGKSYNAIGTIHGIRGNNMKSKENFEKSMEIHEELGNEAEISGCCNNLGNIYRNIGDYSQARKYFIKSLKIRENIGDKKGMAGCFTNIGLLFQEQGSFDKAMEYNLKSLKIYEELDDRWGMDESYHNIAVIYGMQKNYEKAVEYFSKSLKISEELGNKSSIASSYLSIGVVQAEQCKYKNALENYLLALNLKEELGDEDGIATCYTNIGIIYKEQGDFDKALEYYIKSVKISEELDNQNSRAYVYGSIADLYITKADSNNRNNPIEQTTNLQTAIEYAHKGYSIAAEIGALPIQNEASAYLQKAYSKLGNYKEALKYAEIYIATRDSLYSDEKTKALAEMTAKYEAEKKQLQIEKMEKQKELDDKTIEAQQAENRKQQLIIISAIGGFLVVLTFSIIILSMFRQKKMANVLLASQNDEINQQKDQIEAKPTPCL